MPDKRTAWLIVRESLRDFRWYEWAPFGWILAAQLLFLLCAVNLGTSWGMLVAGSVTMAAAGGETFLRYPQFFLALPTIAALVEWILYVVAGAVLIPLAILRISEPAEPRGPRDTQARLLRAILPVLAGGIVNLLVLQAWQWAMEKGPAPFLLGYFPGGLGRLVVWLLGVVVSYLISAPFLLIPVNAVQRGSTFGGALVGGFREGLRMIVPAFLVVLLFSWPSLIFLGPVQIMPQVIVNKLRPELVALLLALYATVMAFANYLIYAAVTRLHLARQA